MDIPDSMLERYQSNKDKAPRHEKAASVNEIIRVLGESRTYNYTYWLNKVGSATYSQVTDILKEASSLEKKYSKGGFITNKLKVYAVPNTRTKRLGVNRRGTDGNKKGDKSGQSRDTRVSKVDDSKRRVEPES
jgi:hypothetical protein